MIQVNLHEAKLVKEDVSEANDKMYGVAHLQDSGLNTVAVYCNQPADARRIADAFARLAAEMDKASK